MTDDNNATESTTEKRTRRIRTTSERLQAERDRKQTEVIKLEVRCKQLRDERDTMAAKLDEARAELGRLDLALGRGHPSENARPEAARARAAE